jgi:hypothetical protein
MAPVEAFPLDGDDHLAASGTRQSILEAFRSVAPDVDVTHPAHVTVRDGGCSIICNLEEGEPVRGPVVNVYGTSWDVVISQIAQALNAFAYDIGEGQLVLRQWEPDTP